MPERWPDTDAVSVAQHRDARDVIMRVSSVGIVLPTSPALSSLSFLHALFGFARPRAGGGYGWGVVQTRARPHPPHGGGCAAEARQACGQGRRWVPTGSSARTISSERRMPARWDA